MIVQCGKEDVIFFLQIPKIIVNNSSLSFSNDFLQCLQTCFLDVLDGFQLQLQFLGCLFADALDVVQLGMKESFLEFLPVMCDAESVRLVTDVLYNLQGLGTFVYI